jgi:hypothetical protein
MIMAPRRCEFVYHGSQWREPTAEEEDRAPRVNGFTLTEALALAIGILKPMGMGTDPTPLADYVASRAPSHNDRLRLAEFLRLLPKSPPRGSRGRGRHKRVRLGRNKTVYDMARHVAEQQKLYCKQHPTRTGRPRKHIPIAETRLIIKRSYGDAYIDDVLRVLKNKSRL